MPSTFVACGHDTNYPAAGPSVTNTDHVDFRKASSMFMKPALCLECSITNIKNRQQLVTDSWTAKSAKMTDDLLERAMNVGNQKDREEILVTGKAVLESDNKLQSDAEKLILWQDFAKVWQGAERSKITEKRDKSNPYQPKVIRTTHTEVLTVLVGRTEEEVTVTLVWRSKPSLSQVERIEVDMAL